MAERITGHTELIGLMACIQSDIQAHLQCIMKHSQH